MQSLFLLAAEKFDSYGNSGYGHEYALPKSMVIK
jgi:hypothetical protein